MAPFLGGAEVALKRLATGLQEEGHEVCVILGADNDVADQIRSASLPYVISPMCYTDKWHWWRYRSARSHLRRKFRAERPDIVHSNDLNTHQIVSDAASGLGIPRICHHRWLFEGEVIDWLNKFGCDRHIFVSKSIRDAMCSQSHTLAESPVAVVHDGLPIPPMPTSEDRLAARRILNMPLDKTIVIFSGQIIARKGIADLLHAWALLPESSRERANLFIIGDDLENKGQYRLEMQELASDLGIAAQFVGFQSDVYPWLKASNIAVVPSHVEPLGLVSLEAMTCALPVIGGDVGGIPEVVVHDQTGLLVPPHCPEALSKAIDRLLNDPLLATELGGNGRKRCEEHFSLHSHVRAVTEQYQLSLDKSHFNRALEATAK